MKRKGKKGEAEEARRGDRGQEDQREGWKKRMRSSQEGVAYTSSLATEPSSMLEGIAVWQVHWYVILEQFLVVVTNGQDDGKDYLRVSKMPVSCAGSHANI